MRLEVYRDPTDDTVKLRLREHVGGFIILEGERNGIWHKILELGPYGICRERGARDLGFQSDRRDRIEILR